MGSKSKLVRVWTAEVSCRSSPNRAFSLAPTRAEYTRGSKEFVLMLKEGQLWDFEHICMDDQESMQHRRLCWP
jgi:hypothetical protein